MWCMSLCQALSRFLSYNSPDEERNARCLSWFPLAQLYSLVSTSTDEVSVIRLKIIEIIDLSRLSFVFGIRSSLRCERWEEKLDEMTKRKYRARRMSLMCSSSSRPSIRVNTTFQCHNECSWRSVECSILVLMTPLPHRIECNRSSLWDSILTSLWKVSKVNNGQITHIQFTFSSLTMNISDFSTVIFIIVGVFSREDMSFVLVLHRTRLLLSSSVSDRIVYLTWRIQLSLDERNVTFA